MSINKNTVAILDPEHIRIENRKFAITKPDNGEDEGDERTAAMKIDSQWSAIIDDLLDNRKFTLMIMVGVFVLIWGVLGIIFGNDLSTYLGIAITLFAIVLLVWAVVRHRKVSGGVTEDLENLTFIEFCKKRAPEFLDTLDFYGVNYNI